MKQLSTALITYLQDSDERLPPSGQGTNACAPGGQGSCGNDPFGMAWYEIGWAEAIFPLIKSVGVYRCPDVSTTPANPGTRNDQQTDTNSYTANQKEAGLNISALAFPAMTFMLLETNSSARPASDHGLTNYQGDYWGGQFGESMNNLTLQRHNNGANYTFSDGHVKWYGATSLGYAVGASNAAIDNANRDPTGSKPTLCPNAAC